MVDPRVLIYYVVEAGLLGFVGLALIGVWINLRQFVIVGLGLGLYIYIIRSIFALYKIPNGFHIPLTLLGLIVILSLVARQGWGISVMGGLLGLLTLALSEILMIPTLYHYLKITTENNFANAWSQIITGFTGDWLLILFALLLFVTKKSPFRM